MSTSPTALLFSIDLRSPPLLDSLIITQLDLWSYTSRTDCITPRLAWRVTEVVGMNTFASVADDIFQWASEGSMSMEIGIRGFSRLSTGLCLFPRQRTCLNFHTTEWHCLSGKPSFPRRLLKKLHIGHRCSHKQDLKPHIALRSLASQTNMQDHGESAFLPWTQSHQEGSKDQCAILAPWELGGTILAAFPAWTKL